MLYILRIVKLKQFFILETLYKFIGIIIRRKIMTDGIKVGMAFGRYDEMVQELSKTCNTEKKSYSEKTDYESEYVFKDKKTGNFKNGFRENIRKSAQSTPLFSNSVIFNGEYQHGTTANNAEELNVFDYIQTKDSSQFALDINGDGIVNENEIFKGKLDYFVYKRAKESGNLANYNNFLNIYKY